MVLAEGRRVRAHGEGCQQGRQGSLRGPSESVAATSRAGRGERQKRVRIRPKMTAWAVWALLAALPSRQWLVERHHYDARIPTQRREKRGEFPVDGKANDIDDEDDGNGYSAGDEPILDGSRSRFVPEK